MIDASVLKPLTDALDEHTRNGGAPVQFWLRDDDAIEPSAALDTLLELTHRFSVPLSLAVIPMHTGNALVSKLHDFPHASVSVHGWSHENYAPATEKKQELGAHRPIDAIIAELSLGFNQLLDAYGERFVPMLVPPWNRVHTSVVSELHGIGFKALSTFADISHDSIAMLNTHVDIIDWKGTRGGRDPDQLVLESMTQVQKRLQPIGLLTHHLVHDDAAWQFLEFFFKGIASRDDVTWVSSQSLLPHP